MDKIPLRSQGEDSSISSDFGSSSPKAVEITKTHVSIPSCIPDITRTLAGSRSPGSRAIDHVERETFDETTRFHADRVVGGDRDHRRPDRTALTRSASRAR